MSRLGKIARLPLAVRDTLNVRLQDGASGPELLAWLNAEPGVQAVLAAHFDGQPINAQNLSEWRRGGHTVWCQQQQIFELAERLHEDQAAMDEVIDGRMEECLATASQLVLLREVRATWGMDGGPDRQRAALAVINTALRLQRQQLDAQRAKRAARQHVEDAPPARPPEPVAAREAAPSPATPARRSPPPAEREPVSPDDDQKIAAVWASAMKLATGKPGKSAPAAASYLPKLPVLQAA